MGAEEWISVGEWMGDISVCNDMYQGNISEGGSIRRGDNSEGREKCAEM